jgi:hypothetical protein
MRSVPYKSCRENENTVFCSFFFSENAAAYEAIWKNTVEADRLQMTV